MDAQSFWKGFLVGSGTTVCELLKEGLISRQNAKDWLEEILSQRSSVPRVALESAKEAMLDLYVPKGCPVPR